MDSNKTFNLTYSPKEQEEIKTIRQKYTPQEEDKMAQLRRLDKSTEKIGKTAALTLGIISTLMLGIGMCCTMVWTNFFILGIIIGLSGIVGILLALPLYHILTKKQRIKLAPQIIKLSNELMLQ